MHTLAAEYGTSAATIRAALHRLQADHLVTVISGWGVFAGDVDPGQG
jgi:DNA-binding GntR family transcriptional regulator